MTIDHIAIRPGDAEYDAARTTVMATAEPAVVLRPTDAAEAAAALDYALAAGLEIAVRSGGHNALGFGNGDGGAVLDVSRLDSVEVLADDRVRLGAGATWGQAAASLADHGLYARRRWPGSSPSSASGTPTTCFAETSTSDPGSLP